MPDWLAITNGTLTARINPLGAELSSLTDADGRELMTDADPAFWTGRAPILFPVVGKPSGEVIRVDGRAYPMKQHGFARHMTFTVSEQHDDWVALTLEANTESRRSYPFEFTLRLRFRVVDATLTIEVEIFNPDRERSLPASFGFHPAFAWPLPFGAPRADHRIVFERDEPDPVKAIAADGTIASTQNPSPVQGDTLSLTDNLFAHDALVWDPIRSQSLTYGPLVDGLQAGPHLAIAFPDTPMLGIWTKPGAHYLCVEPWHGIADPQGYTGEFRDKPGIFTVPSGASKHIGMSVTLVS